MRRQDGMARGTAGRGGIVVIAVALALGAIPAASAAATTAGPGAGSASVGGSVDGRAGELVQALRRRSSSPASLRAAGAPSQVRAGAVSGLGTVSEADALGDADSRVDVSNVSATMAEGRFRFGVTLPSTPDPRSDPGWQVGLSFGAWDVDVNADAAWDYTVGVLMDGGRSFGLVISPDGNRLFCNANAAYARGSRTFSAVVPMGCFGNPARIDFRGGAAYDVDPFGSEPSQIEDLAPDATTLPLTRGPGTAGTAAGYAVSGFGNVRAFAIGTGAQSVRVSRTFPFDIVRGIAATPDGGHAYIVDGFGGLHGADIGTNSFTVEPVGGPYWSGWDIVRGVAVAASGRGGYVLDGFGGLHPFSVGDARAMPGAFGGQYWNGWDVARGLAVLPNGRGGFVLDAFGGLHWFGLGRARAKPVITGAPYWPGRDLARGVSVLPDGTGGYVLDRSGNLYAFGIGGPPPPLPATPSLGARRGLTVIPTAIPLPPPVVP